VLGAALKRGLADVAPFPKPQHSYEARHRYIYAAKAKAALSHRTLGLQTPQLKVRPTTGVSDRIQC
jgi:uncharacterized membrane protein YjgN (DUF898 family)